MEKFVSYLFYLFVLIASSLMLLAALVVFGLELPTTKGKSPVVETTTVDKLYESLDKDAIPAIITPSFTNIASVDLSDDDLVLSVSIKGEKKAYPVNILNWHEVVNDEVGGTPVVISYCPLCRSGLAFHRDIKGKTLSFGVSGKLYQDNLVLYDSETDSLWPQFTGSAISGPLKGTKLERIPLTMMKWKAWKNFAPSGKVLSADTGYDRNYLADPYAEYASSDKLGVSGNSYTYNELTDDKKIPGKDMVIGVITQNGVKAYPLKNLGEPRFINDFIGGKPVLIYFDRSTFTVKAFYRQSKKDPLIFSEGSDAHLVVDENTGSEWSLLDGRAEKGDLEGQILKELPATISYWFAWEASFPETDIYARDE